MEDTDGSAPRPDGRSTRWDAHRARRREQVLDAALVVLDADGPDFGLDRVAARAGVTKPVVYRHVGDRAALVQAMGERATNRLMERLMPAVYADAGPLADRIRASTAILVRFLDESPNVLLLFRPLAPGGTDAVRADEDHVAMALVYVLGGYLRTFGTEDPDAAEVWAHGVVGFVRYTVEWWLERRSPDRDALVDLLALFVRDQFEGIARRHATTLLHGRPAVHRHGTWRRADRGRWPRAACARCSRTPPTVRGRTTRRASTPAARCTPRPPRRADREAQRARSRCPRTTPSRISAPSRPLCSSASANRGSSP